MKIIESLPDSEESMLKMFLMYAIDYHIKHNQLNAQQKAELLILKKFFTISTLRKIFQYVNIKSNPDPESGDVNNMTMIFTDELKLYIDSEYNKYLENNTIIC